MGDFCCQPHIVPIELFIEMCTIPLDENQKTELVV